MSGDGIPPACPVPRDRDDIIGLAHGGGGLMTQRLLARVFFPAFSNPLLDARHDGAAFELGGARLAFTTDAFVVRPLFFPGGDIGTLAVCGSVNDLAMCGAEPLYLSGAFILEEGLQRETLERVVESMRRTAGDAGVLFAAGDTKVVERGHADGLYICTAGIGAIRHERAICPKAIEPGDAILLSGDLGRHGIAVMARREGLEFETELQSDCAPLWHPVRALLEGGVRIHCMRDLTRGGLAAALVEIASAARRDLAVIETEIPVGEAVRGACELLGLDPLHVANEGRFIAFVPPEDAACALALLRACPVSAESRQIGEVGSGRDGQVALRTALGSVRSIYLPSGEQLPRIC